MTDAVRRRPGGGAMIAGNGSSFTPAKQRMFLDTLARTANVTRSRCEAGASERQVYKLRQRNPAFRAAWTAALTEAYEALEATLLDHAINGYAKPIVRNGEHTGDIHETDHGLMLRLLAMHRDTVKGPRASAGDVAASRAEVARRLEVMAERLALPPPEPIAPEEG